MTTLTHILGHNIRNLRYFSIIPSSGINYIIGKNGSGKTTFLEALQLLTSSRSYRTRQLRQLLSLDADKIFQYSSAKISQGRRGVVGGDAEFVLDRDFDSSFNSSVANHIQLYRGKLYLHASVAGEFRNRNISLLLEQENNYKLQIHVDSQVVYKSSQLFQNFPHRFLSPESLNLVDGTPEQRRNYIDWLLFHVEQNYHSDLTDYLRVVKQRNELLKNHKIDRLQFQSKIWEKLVSEKGVIIDRFRSKIIDAIKTTLPNMALLFHNNSGILNNSDVKDEQWIDICSKHTVTYHHGWPKNQNLFNVLVDQQQQDLRNGYTSYGPHRSDFSLYMDKYTETELESDNEANHDSISHHNNDAIKEDIDKKASSIKMKSHSSRGEKKRIDLLLFFTQIELVRKISGKSVLVLIDDLFSELDTDNIYLLLSIIRNMQLQVFITLTDKDRYFLQGNDLVLPGDKLFHVEQGTVTEIEITKKW